MAKAWLVHFRWTPCINFSRDPQKKKVVGGHKSQRKDQSARKVTPKASDPRDLLPGGGEQVVGRLANSERGTTGEATGEAGEATGLGTFGRLKGFLTFDTLGFCEKGLGDWGSGVKPS